MIAYIFLLIETKSKKPSDCIVKQCKFLVSCDVNDSEQKISIIPCKVVVSRFDSTVNIKVTRKPNDDHRESQQESPSIVLRRSQRKIPEKIVPENKIHNNLSQVSGLITPIQMTNILWRSMIVKGLDIKVGMLVCAKMNTYWPWPAQVTGLFRKKARVKFFGDLREGSVDISACVPFYNCQAIVLNYVNIIDEKTKNAFKQNVIDNLEQTRNNFHKKVSLKYLYLQAIRDIELYAGKEESFILSIL